MIGNQIEGALMRRLLGLRFSYLGLAVLLICSCSFPGDMTPGMYPRVLTIGYIEGGFELAILDLQTGSRQALTNRRIITPSSFDYHSGEASVVFSALAGDGKQIFLITPQTEPWIPLTQGNDRYEKPSWSPNADAIAFNRTAQDGTAGIFIMDVDDQQIYPLMSDSSLRVRNPTWSSNPDLIAVLISRSESEPDEGELYDIAIVSVETGTVVFRIEGGIDARRATLSWSPSGNELAYAVVRDQSYGIFITDVMSGNETPIATSGADEWLPVWAPDCKTLAYLSSPQGSRLEGQVYVASLVDHQTSLLTPQVLPINGLLWIDGNQLLMSTYDHLSTTTTFISLNATTGAQTILASWPGSYSSPHLIR